MRRSVQRASCKGAGRNFAMQLVSSPSVISGRCMADEKEPLDLTAYMSTSSESCILLV